MRIPTPKSENRNEEIADSSLHGTRPFIHHLSYAVSTFSRWDSDPCQAAGLCWYMHEVRTQGFWDIDIQLHNELDITISDRFSRQPKLMSTTPGIHRHRRFLCLSLPIATTFSMIHLRITNLLPWWTHLESTSVSYDSTSNYAISRQDESGRWKRQARGLAVTTLCKGRVLWNTKHSTWRSSSLISGAFLDVGNITSTNLSHERNAQSLTLRMSISAPADRTNTAVVGSRSQ